jgi:L-alanine-DL-glutamate epimerase-like enolase superfamily enzyme
MLATDLELIEVRVPLAPGIGETRSGVLRMTAAEHLLVVLRDGAGHTGVGEIVPRLVLYGETVASCRGFVESVVLPRLPEMSSLHDLVELLRPYPGNPAAKAGVELAAWDLWARRLRASVTELHGGPASCSVPVTWTVSYGSPGDMASRAAAAVADGYRSVKVKVGREPAVDVAAVTAVRQAVGEKVELAVDANQRWGFGEAVRALAPMHELGVAYVEEPLPVARRGDRERLARAVPVPHAVDEGLCTVADGLREVAWGIATVFVVKATRSGLRAAVELAALARAAGLGIRVGTMRELAPGTAANAHLAAVVGAASAELGPSLQWTHALGRDPVPIVDSRYQVSAAAGFGVDLDAEVVSRFRASPGG